MQFTILSMFEKSVSKYGRNDMFWEKEKGSDTYTSTTYSQMHARVMDIAAGLISIGVGKGDKVAILSQGRREWITAELGALSTGAVSVPLSVKLEESDLHFRLVHSETKVLFISEQQYPKLKHVIADIVSLQKVILFDEHDSYADNEMTVDQLCVRGRQWAADGRADVAAYSAQVQEDDDALISYTSGTSAQPKGIILTHRNMVHNAYQGTEMYPLTERDRMLLILPLDHSFAHTTGMYTFMICGASLASVQSGRNANETLRHIPQNIREIKPTILISVPALAKNFRKNIETGIKEKGPKVEKLFAKALNVAYKYNGNGWDRGKGMRWIYKPMYLFYDKLLFSKIRQNFGGQLKAFVGGGALLDIELQRFFSAIGIPMYQGYGLSEASPVISSNMPGRHKMGSSGVIVPRMDLKICDMDGNALPVGETGEIVVRGGNIMKGYFKNPEATAEALRDGWLHSGDMGYMDADGFLYVMGRFKSLLIASDGEKYSPEGIESSMEDNSRYIDQVMLHNDQDPYTVALIVINKPAVNAYLGSLGLTASTIEGQNAVIDLVQSEINAYKTGGRFEDMFPHRWLPSTFAILPEAFTGENKFLNSTLKMVRGKITEHYAPRLGYMFSAEGKAVHNDQNFTCIEQFLK